MFHKIVGFIIIQEYWENIHNLKCGYWKYSPRVANAQYITSRGEAQIVLEILNINFFCMDGLIRMNRDKFQCLLETLPLIWFIYLFLKVSCENGTSEFNIFINKRAGDQIST